MDNALGSAAFSAGALTSLVGKVDRAAQAAAIFQNGTAGTQRAISTIGSVNTSIPMSVGRQTASLYQDFEFYGAAIFRRALSDREITALSNYFTGRIA